VQGTGGPAVLTEWIVTLDAAGRGGLELPIPAGLATVTVGTLAALDVEARFVLSGSLGRLAGHASAPAAGEDEADAALEVLPDTSEETYYRTASGAPLVYALPGPATTLPAPPAASTAGTLLRLRLSVPLESPAEGDELPVGATVRFVDAAGGPILTSDATGLATFRRAAHYVGGSRADVPSEPFDVFAIAPAGARAMIVEAAEPVDVAVAFEVEGAVRHGFVPDDLRVPPGLRIADGAHADDRYDPLCPEDPGRLAGSGRRRVIARARELVREVEEPVATAGTAVALAPDVYEVRGKLLEPLPPEAAPTREEWGETLFVEIPGGETAVLDVRELSPGGGAAEGKTFEPAGAHDGLPVTLRGYHDLGPASASGGDGVARVVIDGTPVLTLPPGERRGQTRVPDVLPGRREVLFEAPAGGRLLLDRPGTTLLGKPLPVHRERTVFLLEPGKPLVVEVARAEDRDLLLNCGLYLPATASLPVTLDVRIVGGAGARRPGIVSEATALERRVVLLDVPATPIVDLDGFRTEEFKAFVAFVPLRADLAPGPCRVEVRLREGPLAWARFVVTRPDVPILERARLKALRSGR
jgi:hypothetical protein